MNDKELRRVADQCEIVLVAAVLIALAGCVGYVNAPRAGAEPAGVTLAAPDNYLYYPNYEIYYSSTLHQYAYLDGGAWVSRPQPGGVSVNVLLASPSVRMDFHDAPSNHHAAIARQYPKNWKPAAAKQVRKDDERGGK